VAQIINEFYYERGGWGGDCHASDGVEGGTIRGASVRVGRGGVCSKRAVTEGRDSRSETVSVRELTVLREYQDVDVEYKL
jgi:hypothetical protein